MIYVFQAIWESRQSADYLIPDCLFNLRILSPNCPGNLVLSSPNHLGALGNIISKLPTELGDYIPRFPGQFGDGIPRLPRQFGDEIPRMPRHFGDIPRVPRQSANCPSNLGIPRQSADCLDSQITWTPINTLSICVWAKYILQTEHPILLVVTPSVTLIAIQRPTWMLQSRYFR